SVSIANQYPAILECSVPAEAQEITLSRSSRSSVTQHCDVDSRLTIGNDPRAVSRVMLRPPQVETGSAHEPPSSLGSYSSRRIRIGSANAARAAGTSAASAATPSTIATTLESVAGSEAETPYSMFESTRAKTADSATPHALAIA